MENKEQLDKEIKEIEQNSNLAEKFMQDFDDYFGTETSSRINAKVLESMFTNFVSLCYQHSDLYRFMLDKDIEIQHQLIPSLNKNQQELFECYDLLQTKFNNEYGLRAFIMGYVIANELNTENNSGKSIIQEYIQDIKSEKSDKENTNNLY